MLDISVHASSTNQVVDLAIFGGRGKSRIYTLSRSGTLHNFDVIPLIQTISVEFLDTINYAICRVVNDYLGDEASRFFVKAGEYHLEEALRRGLIKLDPDAGPLDNLIGVAKYLESVGYMEKISIVKLSDSEAIVEMFGVSVTKSSVDLLKAGRHPSHLMTNIMLATLKKLGIEAELRETEFNEQERHFKEHWKILEPTR